MPPALLASAGGGPCPPYWSVLPFAATLLGIAILPLAAPHWWERNRNKAAFAWAIAAPCVIWWLLAFDSHALVHSAREYVSFILLLGSLYVASGGIYLEGSLGGAPRANAAFLVVGAVLSNVIGTTGASMLLLRPFLRANAHRPMAARVVGVVFFTFLVSNIGGCLTPLGDPPLFLGFLRGVPFAWTFGLYRQWLVALLAVAAVYYLLDRGLALREPPAPAREAPAPFGVEGWRNALLLLAIVGVVVGQGRFHWPFGVQEGSMAAVAAVSLRATPRALRERNRFTFGPIVEVAVLFSGIFATMVPALAILDARGAEMGIERPWQYFWATGALSSFLDNAPTYLTFATTASAQSHVDPARLGELAAHFPHLLAAISCGAVFMGANTYIGNGPNFMVKAIAEENGVAMPSFFGYMKYSVGILVPVFVVVTLLFFRG
ncbi:MAG: sodium:proton antiporter [Planctomycetota bacterium]